MAAVREFSLNMLEVLKIMRPLSILAGGGVSISYKKSEK